MSCKTRAQGSRATHCKAEQQAAMNRVQHGVFCMPTFLAFLASPEVTLVPPTHHTLIYTPRTLCTLLHHAGCPAEHSWHQQQHKQQQHKQQQVAATASPQAAAAAACILLPATSACPSSSNITGPYPHQQYHQQQYQ